VKAGRLTWLLVIAVLVTSGCWDQRDPEEVAWVLVLGLDRRPRDRVEATALIAVPRFMGPGGGAGGEPFFVTAIEGDTICDALQLINTYIGRRLNLSHTKAVVVGMDTAKQGIRMYLDALARHREARRITSLLVSEVPAGKFIRAMKPRLDPDPGRYMEELVGERRFTAFYERSMLHDILVALDASGDAPMAIRAVLTGEGEQRGYDIELEGGVVFSGDRAVGTLGGQEMQVVSMLRGTFDLALLTFPPPVAGAGPVSLVVRQGIPPRVTVEVRRVPPRIRVQLSLEADIMAAGQGQGNGGQAHLVQIQEHAARALEERARNVVVRAQDEFAVDIFGFGRHAQYQFLTWSQWQDWRWMEQFPGMVVEVEVRLEIRRVGLHHVVRRMNR
jgi:spore germination protein KC